MNYIGIDIGDGESCVCILPASSDIEPRPITITGQKSFISALAKDQNGEIVIGADAVSLGLSDGFSVRFKSRFLSGKDNSHEDMSLFLEKIHDILEKDNRLTGDHVISVGCPAGWDEGSRNEYLNLIRKAGFTNARLVSESRAAFLYAKYARTIQLDPMLLEDSALVIDIGSSTLDFAYVTDGKETGVGTFGDVYLGGGAIDEALLHSAVNTSPYKGEFLSIFQNALEWRNYCLLTARKLKEEYFTRQGKGEQNIRCREMLTILYDRPLPLEINANDMLIWREVNAPIRSLNGTSFYQILKKALIYAREQTKSKPPKLVLLTGGASRMKFFQDLCRECFPKSEFVLCEEPELSIAKGLAYSGRLDDNIHSFNEEINAYMESEKIHITTEGRMDALISSISNTMADIAFNESVEKYKDWVNNKFATLKDMNEALVDGIRQKLQENETAKDISGNVINEVNIIGSLLQPDIDDICMRHGISTDQMHLNISNIPNNMQNIGGDLPPYLEFLQNALQIIISIVVYIILFLIPGAWILDIILAAVTFVLTKLGQKPIGSMIETINFPPFIRNMIPLGRIINTSFRDKLYKRFHEELTANQQFKTEVAEKIEEGLKAYISHLLKTTEIAISSKDNDNGK